MLACDSGDGWLWTGLLPPGDQQEVQDGGEDEAEGGRDWVGAQGGDGEVQEDGAECDEEGECCKKDAG